MTDNSFFFQAEDGIRDLVRSRGLGDVYKRQVLIGAASVHVLEPASAGARRGGSLTIGRLVESSRCLLYTSDAADERSSVDLGGRRIIKKKKRKDAGGRSHTHKTVCASRARRIRR